MKVAIYCRLSEEDKNKQCETDDSGSIQNQKAMLLQHAMEQGWELYNIYSDDDYAGADRRRPEFNRLLRDAEARRFDIVLCKTQSRFTRELELVEKYIHGLFPIWGIRFVSIVDNADTANKGNKKSRQINALVNEWYLEDMSENIRCVLTNRRQQGFHIGAFALYGYVKDPDQKGHLLIDDVAARVVRMVFELFTKGYGKTAIARMLNEQGIPNPSEYKRLCGLRYQQPPTKNGTLWKYSAISAMLTNEIYIGNMVQGKYGSISYKTKQNKPRPQSEWYIVQGTHEPIIDRKLWERAQAMVKERTKPFGTGMVGLFSKKVRCACCGYRMCTSKNRGKQYLQCATRHYAKGACEGAFISAERLKQRVLSEIRRLSAEYLEMDEQQQNIEFRSSMQEQKKRLHEEVTDARKKLEESARAVRELYLDKMKRLITESDFTELSKEFAREKDRAERIIANAEEQINEIDARIAAGNCKRELMEKYVDLADLDREVMDTFIEEIKIGKRNPETRENPIQIRWKF